MPLRTRRSHRLTLPLLPLCIYFSCLCLYNATEGVGRWDAGSITHLSAHNGGGCLSITHKLGVGGGISSSGVPNRQPFKGTCIAVVMVVCVASALFGKARRPEWTRTAVLYRVTRRGDERQEWALHTHTHTLCFQTSEPL